MYQSLSAIDIDTDDTDDSNDEIDITTDETDDKLSGLYSLLAMLLNGTCWMILFWMTAVPWLVIYFIFYEYIQITKEKEFRKFIFDLNEKHPEAIPKYYVKRFSEHGIDSMDKFILLHNKKLKGFGMKNVETRKVLLTQIIKYNAMKDADDGNTVNEKTPIMFDSVYQPKFKVIIKCDGAKNKQINGKPFGQIKTKIQKKKTNKSNNQITTNLTPLHVSKTIQSNKYLTSIIIHH
eukprot:543558_1